MLSNSYFTMASASVISPTKTEKVVISPQKTGLKCTFTVGPFIVFIGDNGMGTVALPSNSAPGGFYEWNFPIGGMAGSLLCFLFGN